MRGPSAFWGERLGVKGPAQDVQAQAVKNTLRDNTDEAIATGVFGAPTLVANQEFYWGDDALPMLLDYLKDPGLYETPEMKRISYFRFFAVITAAGTGTLNPVSDL